MDIQLAARGPNAARGDLYCGPWIHNDDNNDKNWGRSSLSGRKCIPTRGGLTLCPMRSPTWNSNKGRRSGHPSSLNWFPVNYSLDKVKVCISLPIILWQYNVQWSLHNLCFTADQAISSNWLSTQQRFWKHFQIIVLLQNMVLFCETTFWHRPPTSIHLSILAPCLI